VVPVGQVEDGKPLRADAVRNRQRVLDAAELVLAREGVGAPIDDIAHEAGVGVGTVYRHFPTKEALLQAVMAQRVQALADAARECLDAEDAGATFFEFIGSWVDVATGHKALADEIADAGLDVKAATAEPKQQLRDALGALLARAQDAGAVRADVELEDVMILLAGACLAFNHGDVDERQRGRTMTILCDGLRP
jgi:AcrR family transcriptional regulator